MGEERRRLKKQIDLLESKIHSLQCDLNVISQYLQQTIANILVSHHPEMFSRFPQDQCYLDGLLQSLKCHCDEIRRLCLARHENQCHILRHLTMEARTENGNFCDMCHPFSMKAYFHGSGKDLHSDTDKNCLQHNFSTCHSSAFMSPVAQRQKLESSLCGGPCMKPCCEVGSTENFTLHRNLANVSQSSLFSLNPHTLYQDKRDYHLQRYPKDDNDNVTKMFTLPEKVTAEEIIHLWNFGTEEIPPVRLWTNIQKRPQKSKISRWKKIVEIFEEKYKSDWSEFVNNYKDEDGRLMPVSKILALNSHEETLCHLRPPWLNNKFAQVNTSADDSREPTDETLKRAQETTAWPCSTVKHSSENEKLVYDQLSSSTYTPVDYSDKFTSNYSEQREYEECQLSYTLPKKVNGNRVNPLDVIRIWEKGTDTIPPVKNWTTMQKISQQSKISRWRKVYQIYKKHCKGDIEKFVKLITDKEGKTLSVANVCKMDH